MKFSVVSAPDEFLQGEKTWLVICTAVDDWDYSLRLEYRDRFECETDAWRFKQECEAADYVDLLDWFTLDEEATTEDQTCSS